MQSGTESYDGDMPRSYLHVGGTGRRVSNLTADFEAVLERQVKVNANM